MAGMAPHACNPTVTLWQEAVHMWNLDIKNYDMIITGNVCMGNLWVRREEKKRE
jgi:hypothetical protein